MWLLILEALGALALFVFIVVWTMSGRRRTEAPEAAASASAPPSEADTQASGTPPHDKER